MMKRSTLIVLAGLVVFVGCLGMWILHRRAVQRQWPLEQFQNAVALGKALSKYHETYGSYPARLEDLVAGGTLDRNAFERLQFRAGPSAAPEPWLYSPPDQPSEIAIVGPTAIPPWSGHSGLTATACADGSGEAILGTKSDTLPAWARK
ncbi:MAG: hypothetical protein KDK97_09535 [Verrucomicrobiales bacterium]|nr:hypothetical protein [Verrucomicrobiales bacterium]MCP5557449.1 hypothetical protein [Verrucomicrobiaceae bacterium]